MPFYGDKEDRFYNPTLNSNQNTITMKKIILFLSLLAISSSVFASGKISGIHRIQNDIVVVRANSTSYRTQISNIQIVTITDQEIQAVESNNVFNENIENQPDSFFIIPDNDLKDAYVFSSEAFFNLFERWNTSKKL